jgi:uncharacterized coiled-coil DUF342 family protein
MSNKTTKVKMNESHLNEIRQLISRIGDSYDPLYNEAHELRTRFKKHMDILMNLRIFAEKYGTLVMVQKMAKVYQKIDKIDNELYNIKDKLLTVKSKHDGLDDLFNKYEKFCNK